MKNQVFKVRSLTSLCEFEGQWRKWLYEGVNEFIGMSLCRFKQEISLEFKLISRHQNS